MTQAFNPAAIVSPLSANQLVALILAAEKELYRLTDDLDVAEQSDAVRDAMRLWSQEIDAADDAENAYDAAAEHSLTASQLGIATGRIVA